MYSRPVKQWGRACDRRPRGTGGRASDATGNLSAVSAFPSVLRPKGIALGEVPIITMPEQYAGSVKETDVRDARLEMLRWTLDGLAGELRDVCQGGDFSELGGELREVVQKINWFADAITTTIREA